MNSVPASPLSVADAYRECERIAQRHYENFPVASLFLPRQIRPSIAAIYAFARAADDFADEGTAPPEVRVAALNDWQRKLDDCCEGRSIDPVFIALGDVVRRKNIPKQLLSDLISAFRMDVVTSRYQTFDDLLFYCKHSANPVGRLVLHLFEDAHEEKLVLSDYICTALQLANFWQDVGIDLQKGRIYVPLEDMGQFGYTENEFVSGIRDERFIGLMKFQVERTEKLFAQGRPLLRTAAPGLRFELELTWNGGMKVLEKIRKTGFDVFETRPAIGLGGKMMIFLKSLLYRTR